MRGPTLGLALALWLALAACAPAARSAWAGQEHWESNIDFALRLNQDAKKVEPSATNAKELAAAIDERIGCYRQYSKPQDRIEVCHRDYMKEIVEAARQNIGSLPELGLFLRAVAGCPIVYSMCIGEIADGAACRVRERQCIDCQLDRYWRGGGAAQAAR